MGIFRLRIPSLRTPQDARTFRRSPLHRKIVKSERRDAEIPALALLVARAVNIYIKAVAGVVKLNAHVYMIVKIHITLHLLNLRENFLCESSRLCESFSVIIL